jgi:hypothetical protein
MLIPQWIEELWRAEHTLTPDAVQALHDRGDVGDVHPIITGIELLREHEAHASAAVDWWARFCRAT